jgi:hypothetical protein
MSATTTTEANTAASGTEMSAAEADTVVIATGIDAASEHFILELHKLPHEQREIEALAISSAAWAATLQKNPLMAAEELVPAIDAEFCVAPSANGDAA